MKVRHLKRLELITLYKNKKVINAKSCIRDSVALMACENGLKERLGINKINAEKG